MNHAARLSLWSSEEFRRLLAWSAGLHLLLGLLLVVSPSFRRSVDLPATTYVTVVAAAPSPPAPAPAAAPTPAAEPPAPPRQQVDEIVIPEKPKPLPEPKPEPKPKPEPPRPKPEPKPAAPPPPSADDLMASLREDAQARAPAPSPGTAGGAPGISDPERAAYSQKVHALLYQSWAGVQVCRSLRQPVARFQVELAPSGRLGRVRILQGSDSRHCDAAGERAIRRTEFPTPPRGIDEVIVSFDPDVHF